MYEKPKNKKNDPARTVKNTFTTIEFAYLRISSNIKYFLYQALIILLAIVKWSKSYLKGFFMKTIVANWKMNGDEQLCDNLIFKLKDFDVGQSLIICPPFPLLFKFKNCRFCLGAQNCGIALHGAFTGEVSPQLLRSLGCSYVIIGHSERRRLCDENDDILVKKYEIAIEANLIPIICVGENFQEDYRLALEKQLNSFLKVRNLEKSIIAYEPVRSIGTGIIPDSDKIAKIVSFIKGITSAKILYGGSVDSSNVADILRIDPVDGVLIGGASLRTEEFYSIIQIAKNCC
ncbi:MAG: triosephosphate isomerase [Alphaproteobacteria bacterium]|nr:triosephosphate isomerase [Alphaproteobacteria bacterium]